MPASSEELLAADLALRPLVRRLCSCVLGGDHFWAPEQRQRAVARLEDTAWSVLLGLHPDAAPPYVPPDERCGAVAARLAAAGAALEDDGYPSLARDLRGAVEKLNSCDTYPLLGSITEAETGAVSELPLREHAQLLAFLLSLHGSQPSLRQQRFTFQLDAGPLPWLPSLAEEHKAGSTGPCASTATDQLAGAAAPCTPPLPLGAAPTMASAGASTAPVLTSSVFDEAPDPYALTNGSSAVAVLLPGEVGLPAQAFAGSEEVQDLAAGLGSRPAWDPASSAALPPLRSAAWLPVPASLAELRGDARRGARPPQLGLALSLLSMGDEPGSSTLFSPAAGEGCGSDDDNADAASADSVQPVLGSRNVRRSAGAAGAAASARSVDLSVKLWSLQEAELAQHALLALQGVAASLCRLQALLAAPAALPRRSVATLLHRLADAGELRQRLQHFVDAFTLGRSPAAPSAVGACCTQQAAGSGLASDSLQHAFAVAVADVLRRQSAALQQLEQQQGGPWVQTVALAGTQGRQLHSRGPTLLQVALHSGRLQLQLRRLAELCWCAGGGPTGDVDKADGWCEEGSFDRGCRWQDGGFPAGSELLNYLDCRASEADSTDAPMLRFLYVQALQPYLRHLQSWAFTTNAVAPEFGTAGDKELLTLEFLPPEERSAEALVPVDPPASLQSVHAAFMRAGSQLRLLHSLEPQGRQLAQRLASIAEQELAARWRQQHQQQPASPGAAHAHTTVSFAAPSAAKATAQGVEERPQEAERECWLSLAGRAAAAAVEEAADGSQDLQLLSSCLPQAVHISEERDAARAAAVDGWLAQMALQRRLAEHALAAEHDSRAAAQREQQAERAAQQAAALSSRQSGKAALLLGQQAALREQRARLAAQQEQHAADDRQGQLLAARREHAAAVAELERAVGRANLQPSQPTSQEPALGDLPASGAPAAAGALNAEPAAPQPQSEQPAAAAPPAGPGAQQDGQQAAATAAGQDGAAVAQQQRVPPDLPLLKLGHVRLQDHCQEQQRPQAAVSAAPPARSARQPLLPGFLGLPAPACLPASSRSLFALPPPLQTARGIDAWQAEAAAAAGREGSDSGAGWGEEGAGTLAPLSAVLECCVVQSVLSQYRAVSRACVRLFLDELKVLDHLEALRRFFFMGAGDWADALVARLGAHADALAPVSAHQLEASLAEAIRGSSVESDPYAAHMRIRLLPASTSAITAQVGAICSASPQRRPRSFWNTATTVTLAPTQLDALDCVCLEYRVGWPLSSILPEDTLQGYAAVFSMLVRVRRVEQLLRSLHGSLASQPKSSSDLLLSEEEADRAHRRIQRLRAHHSAASQFVAALQAFLHARAAGDAWVHLLAKLMVSSEEVAATLISREPSTAMTGVLSRMDSVGPAGKAAHKLAQHMSRVLSASQPGSPSAAGPGPGRSSSGQLVRFNSLLSAASAASSAANSAATSPRQGPPLTARQLSRFAGASARGRPAVPAAPATAAAGAAGNSQGAPPAVGQRHDASPGDASPTAATVGGGLLSRMTSLGSVLMGQAAAEAGSLARLDGMGGAAAAAGLDAAAWAQSFQQSQQGIADLQELLDLHRSYVRQTSEDCLTFGGSPAVQAALAGALQCLLDFAFRLRGTVQRGAAARAEETWTQALRLDDAWRPLAATITDYEARVQQLLSLLHASSGPSGLAELALQLDFNGFYSRLQAEADERRQRERWRHVAAAGKEAAVHAR